MTPEDVIRKIMLRVEYRTLSEVSEQFPKKSVHPAMSYINNQMRDILKEIQDLTDKYKKAP